MKLSSSHVNLNRWSGLSGALPNVIKLDFLNLRGRSTGCDRAFLHRCRNCEAIVNWRFPGFTWTCKFCHKSNDLNLKDKTPPELNQTLFLIEEASPDFEPQYASVDTKYLIYCIDISGSMSSTYKIDESIVFPTDDKRGSNSAEDPGKKKVTQLEIIQSALFNNLEQIANSNPEKRIGLVTFSSKVEVIGDGRGEKCVFSGEQLNDLSQLEDLSKNIAAFNSIGRNKDALKKQIIDLEAKGQTALGPALLISILIAARKHGSRVILCTDGLANQGLGSLEKDKNGSVPQESIEFYNRLASLAQRSGVSVSIMTIKDNDSKLGVLQSLVSTTSGTISIADPTKPQLLEHNISTMSTRQGPVAYNLTLTFIVPKEFYIKNYSDPKNCSSTIKKEIGNVTKDMEVFFGVALRDDAKDSAIERVAFQAQLEYMGVDGRKFVKVIFDEFDSTKDEKIVEQNIDLSIIGSHVIKVYCDLTNKDVPSKEIVEIIDIINQLARTNDKFSGDEFTRVTGKIEEIRKEINKNIAQVMSVSHARRQDIVNGNAMQLASDQAAYFINNVMSSNSRVLRK